MGRTASALVALAIVALCALPSQAHEDPVTGTRTLSFGEHFDVRILFDEGTSIDIEYEVTVTAGPPVNVYFVDSGGHEDYEDPTATGFTHFRAWSNVGTTHASEQFTIDTRGTYYVIIENTAASLDNATIEYSVSHAPTPWTRQAVFWAVVAAVLVGVPVAMVLLRRRQGRLPTAAARAPPLG